MEPSLQPGKPARSAEQARRHLAAIGGELAHHFLVQPDVHRGAVVRAACVAELLRE